MFGQSDVEGGEIETSKILDDPTGTPERSNLRSMKIHKIERRATVLPVVWKVRYSDPDMTQVEISVNERMCMKPLDELCGASNQFAFEPKLFSRQAFEAGPRHQQGFQCDGLAQILCQEE